MPRTQPTFARLLRDARESAGLSVLDLAAKAGLHRQTIYAIESGRNQPTWDVVQALASALDVPTDFFRIPVMPANSGAKTQTKGDQ